MCDHICMQQPSESGGHDAHRALDLMMAELWLAAPCTEAMTFCVLTKAHTATVPRPRLSVL